MHRQVLLLLTRVDESTNYRVTYNVNSSLNFDINNIPADSQPPIDLFTTDLHSPRPTKYTVS